MAKMIDITPALSMKLFYQEPKKRFGLWGTLIASNLVWMVAVSSLGILFLSSTKFGSFMAEQYFKERARWSSINTEKEHAIAERDMEIARMIAFQTSSPGDVVQLAKKINSVIETASGKQRQFLEKALPEAMRIQVRYGIPASAVLAMSIYESGYGASELSNEHNYFGMKAFSDWNGERINMPTRDSGVLTRADFRVYPTMLAGFEGYVNFLKNSKRYEAAFSETSGVRFVQKVLAAGYCPDGDYLGNIQTIMSRHRLQELDQALQEGKDAHEIAWKPESNRTEFRKFLAKDRS